MSNHAWAWLRVEKSEQFFESPGFGGIVVVVGAAVVVVVVVVDVVVGATVVVTAAVVEVAPVVLVVAAAVVVVVRGLCLRGRKTPMTRTGRGSHRPSFPLELSSSRRRPSWMYRSRVLRVRCPVWRMMARSLAPRLAAVVA